MDEASKTGRVYLPRENLERVRRHMALSTELANAALRSISFDALLQEAVLLVAEGVGGARVKILEYRTDTEDFLVRAGAGWKDGVVGQATLASDMASPAGRAFRTGKPVHIADLRKEQQFRYSELLREHNVVSVLNVPIKDNDVAYGVLEVDRSTPCVYSEDEASFLIGCANFLIAALLRQRTEEQRDKLSGELQHRLKNNLQIVLSIVELERHKAREEEARNSLAHLSHRISAIATAHRQLSHPEQAKKIDIGAYLRALCANLEQSARDDGGRKQVSLKVEDAVLPYDLALPLGLIANELITNSLEHGISKGNGTVAVAFRFYPGKETAMLSVADDGNGWPKKPGDGLGLSLVDIFTKQIGGELIREKQPRGTKMTVRFGWPWHRH